MLDPTPVRRRKRLWTLALAAAALAAAMVLSTQGLRPGVPAILGVVSLLYWLLAAGLVAGVYLAAGVGLGLVAARWLMPASGQRTWVALALGPGLMTWASHLLGVAGLLSGPRGQWVAGATVAAGCGVFAWRLAAGVRARPNLAQPPAAGLLWALPVGVLLVAACNPPGWLWESEGFGYDALSYHLPLAQEWARGSRLSPVAHNVYSYLPGGMEAAFLHISALLGGGVSRSGPRGLLAMDGIGAIACQLLHAGFALVAAVLVARACRVVVARAGVDGRAGVEASTVGGAAAIAVPWVTVVSSSAYNESAVNAVFAAGLLVALDDAPAWRRGLACGVLAGLAVTFKPTAAFLVGPAVGLMLLGRLPPRTWAGAVVAGTLGGAAMVTPFLVRNYLASGNPVFPAATGLFGTAHWTAEQAARFAMAHRESGTLLERIGLLVGWTGDGLGGQPRGIFHAQWSIFLPAGLAALVASALWAAARRESVILLLGLGAMTAWWLGWSHCQSRFLLPMVVAMAIGLGVATARAAAAWRARPEAPLPRLGMLACAAVPLLLGAASTRMLLSQRRVERDQPGYPNFFLPEGPAARTGEALRRDLATLPPDERAAMIDALDPEAYMNLVLPDARVYLLGGATPFYFTGSVRYHTTWDACPLGDAARALPNQPERWSDFLLARGIEYVLADFAELSRLTRDGWFDPAVTPETAAMWLLRYARPVKEWARPGEEGAFPVRGLYQLRGTAPREPLL
ncbi:MAG: hypothetical protein JNK35_12470 [Phycisphaerae bacterium]|nr:hypothetical protein [Phycisphaerae bacterium]